MVSAGNGRTALPANWVLDVGRWRGIERKKRKGRRVTGYFDFQAAKWYLALTLICPRISVSAEPHFGPIRFIDTITILGDLGVMTLRIRDYKCYRITHY